MASMTIQAMLQETAAGEMTNLMKKSWFEALLRQDMAYHDMRDVAGQATIITSSGNKFKSESANASTVLGRMVENRESF